MLRVGPQSAGASPGPACYGLGGTEPTVTDANLVLGRLGADRFLGGEMKLDTAAAKKALTTHIGEPLGMDAIASRRRHPAHRRYRDVLRGQRRHHRARSRCRRLCPGRLWRRRAAARGRGRARDRHAPRHRSRARRVCSPPMACCSPTCATISCEPGSRGSTMPRSRRSRRSTRSSKTKAGATSPPPRSTPIRS